jgi:hypothetical protein
LAAEILPGQAKLLWPIGEFYFWTNFPNSTAMFWKDHVQWSTNYLKFELEVKV